LTLLKKKKLDGRVNMAWLFGSVARGEDDYKSDIDLMVELKDDKKYSMFDLLD
jgi:predicted nucleotidyltransferase